MNMNGLWVFIGIVFVLFMILAGGWMGLLFVIGIVFAIFVISYVVNEAQKSAGGYEEKTKASHEGGIPNLGYGEYDIVVYKDRIMFNGIQTIPFSRIKRIETDSSKVRVKLTGPYSYGRYGERNRYYMQIHFSDIEGKEQTARFSSWERVGYTRFLSIAKYVNGNIKYVPAPEQPKQQPYEI